MEAELLIQTEAIDATEAEQDVRHGFIVAESHLLIPKGLYSELVSRVRICPIPATPEWFCGFINHRGETVPVYDLTRLSGKISTTSQDKRWILLLDEHPLMVGILLDSAPQGLATPRRLNTTEKTVVCELLQPFAGQYYEHQGSVWAEFEHRQFFTALKKLF
ncbi:MAG: chemotaxis protein CheW [Pontibacterium sp.]